MAWGAPRGIDDIVARISANDPSFTALCLFKGRRFDDADAAQLCDALEGNTCLRELSLACHALSHAQLLALARMLAVNQGLHTLDLGNSSLGDEGLAALAPGLAAAASLARLNLDAKGLSAAGCTALGDAFAASVGRGRSLKELVLGGNAIGAEGLQALLAGLGAARGFGSACRLAALDAAGCGLRGGAGAAPLATALAAGRLPALCALRLADNALGDEGAAALADALRERGQGLRDLHMQRCGLGAAGAAALAAALPSDLRSLDLSGNDGIGAGGAAPLARALGAGAAPRLSALLLARCDLGDGAVAGLAAALGRRPPAGGAGEAAAPEAAAARAPPRAGQRKRRAAAPCCTST